MWLQDFDDLTSRHVSDALWNIVDIISSFSALRTLSNLFRHQRRLQRHSSREGVGVVSYRTPLLAAKKTCVSGFLTSVYRLGHRRRRTLCGDRACRSALDVRFCMFLRMLKLVEPSARIATVGALSLCVSARCQRRTLCGDPTCRSAPAVLFLQDKRSAPPTSGSKHTMVLDSLVPKPPPKKNKKPWSPNSVLHKPSQIPRSPNSLD